MAAPAVTPSLPAGGGRRERVDAFLVSLRPVWSKPAAYRALRATLVMPGLFALTSQVIKNPQIATYAAFGSFATLVFAGFGGTRREKLTAHLGLAVVGSVLLVIGTAVNATVALAAVVTVPVAFVVLFGGIAGANAASATTAALLAYVLAAASPGTISMVPSRLAGWWLASAVGTLAVLLIGPRASVDRLQASAGRAARAMSDELALRLEDRATLDDRARSSDAERAMSIAFTATPYRPSGLSARSEALGHVVEDLEWVGSLLSDVTREGVALASASETDERLLQKTVAVLRDTGIVLEGGEVRPCVESLEQATIEAAQLEGKQNGELDRSSIDRAFHARLIATASRNASIDSLIALGRVLPEVVTAERARWQGRLVDPLLDRSPRYSGARQLVDHATVRSVWFLNSARGAVALAAAVAAADLLNVQHGFWVVLGALSVLRTNAASTGANALRALAGTSVGFFIGAALILLIGSHPDALWAALPVAVLAATYTPGTAPFAVSQAAFTVTLSLLYNILVPVGWRVGVIRIEDVGLGAGVSIVIGLLFWPRGAGAVVGDDLAENFHLGGVYLVQATSWALGLRSERPSVAIPLERASLRLDSALRALAIETGTKRFPRAALWKLVGRAMRLRLTAQSLALLPPQKASSDYENGALLHEAVRIAGVVETMASEIGRAPATAARELVSIPFEEGASPVDSSPYGGWVREYLDHVSRSLEDIQEPLAEFAQRRDSTWWR
jgi:uncharacterized membrane protein YccC